VRTPAALTAQTLFRAGSRKLLYGLAGRFSALADRSARTLAFTLLSREEQRAARRTAGLRGRHSGQPCFVVASGTPEHPPCGRMEDHVTILADATLLSTVSWRPSYCVVSAASLGAVQELPLRVEGGTFLLRDCFPKTPLPQELLAHEKTFLLVRDLGASRTEHNDLDPAKPLQGFWRLPEVAVLAAITLGCSPIYLVGFHCDWLRNPDGGRLVLFNGRLASPYGRALEACVELWHQFAVLRALAGENGTEVLNATESTFLDVFERAPAGVG
jgi:hypothetical protein